MALRNWTDGTAPYLSGPTLDALELDLAAAGKPLTGPGIDLTGTTVSTAAVQAFLNACTDGDTVTVPTGAIINLDTGITLNHRIRLTGSGELRFTAGITSMPAIEPTVDGCQIDHIRITNPNQLAAKTGGTSNRTKNYAIYISANYARIQNVWIDSFQNGIVASPFGVFHHFQILGNRLTNMLGAGDGPSTDGGVTGEDRGDGIYVFGAMAAIVGNTIELAAGQDGRIGIGLEYIDGRATTTYAHQAQQVTIAGNVISGQYRRGIVSEDVAFAAITGNTITDATWWAIALIQTAHYCTVTGNTINWTRTAADNQGSSHAPLRAGIMIFDNVNGAVVQGNTIHGSTASTLPYGIAVSQANGACADVDLIGNHISTEGPTMIYGIHINNGGTDIRILNNRIRDVATGINGNNAESCTVSGNRIRGTSAASSYGIHFQGTLTNIRADQNTVTAFTTGLALFAVTSWLTASGNVISSATTGINTFNAGAGIPSNVGMNQFVSVTTKTSNLSSAAVTTGNN